MIIKNIFENLYHTRENAWTEALVKFLANSNKDVVDEFLLKIGLCTRIAKLSDVVFEMQKREQESIPDATISVGGDFIIHIEVKSGEGFDISQSTKHVDALLEKEHLYKTRVLLLLTNSYREPIEFNGLVKKYKTSPIKIRHMSWHGVDSFVKGIKSKTRVRTIRFLAEHYCDYLEKEVKPMLEWSGFSEGFVSEWQQYYQFRWKISKLVDQIIRQRIESYGDENYGDNLEKSPKVERVRRSTFRYMIWRSRKSWIAVYGGFWGEGECSKSPVVYVGWSWSKNIHQKLEKTARFARTKKVLESKGFSSGGAYLEKCLYVETICGLPVEQQKKKIQRFIDAAIDAIESSGLISLLKKV